MTFTTLVLRSAYWRKEFCILHCGPMFFSFGLSQNLILFRPGVKVIWYICILRTCTSFFQYSSCIRYIHFLSYYMFRFLFFSCTFHLSCYGLFQNIYVFRLMKIFHVDIQSSWHVLCSSGIRLDWNCVSPCGHVHRAR